MSTIKTDRIEPLGSTITVVGGITVGSVAYFSGGITVAGGLSVGSRAYFSRGVSFNSNVEIDSGQLILDKPFSVGQGGGAVTIQTDSAWTAWARGMNWNFGGITSGGGIGMYGPNGTTAEYIYLSYGDQPYGNTASGAFLTYTGKFGVGVKDPVARLQVCGASASDPYSAANSGSFMVTNFTNTRQLQMGTTAGGVWIEGWVPGVGGATLSLQPSGGSVAIGTTTVTSGFRLEVGGTIRCTSVTQTSDRRAKEDIVYLDSSASLDKIMQLNPCEYTMKQENKKTIGFIADEVQSIIPVAVNGEADSPQYQGIDYTPLFTTLLSGVQELSKKIDAQAAEIADLKNKVNP